MSRSNPPKLANSIRTRRRARKGGAVLLNLRARSLAHHIKPGEITNCAVHHIVSARYVGLRTVMRSPDGTQ
jgi:hypothetical protein